MSDDFKSYQVMILESGLEEALNKYRDKIVKNQLDDKEIAELLKKLHEPLEVMIIKTLLHYSSLTNEPDIDKACKKYAYADNISFELLRNGCDCNCNQCYQKHNLSYWLEHPEEKKLWQFLLVAVRGDIKLKGREKMFPYSMLFNKLRRKGYEVAQLNLVFNECICPSPDGIKSIYYDFWESRCMYCKSIFDETIMKRIVKQRVIMEKQYDEKEFYRCKQDSCGNIYPKTKEKCPITDCKTSHPQRISHYFVNTGRIEVNSSYEIYVNLLEDNENGYKATEDSDLIAGFLNYLKHNRPWSLILAISFFEHNNSEGVPLSTPDLFQSILEGKWSPSDMEWFVNMLAFTVGDEKKYDIPVKKIRNKLLVFKVEMERRRVDTDKNSTDIKLQIAELGDLFRNIVKQHLSLNC